MVGLFILVIYTVDKESLSIYNGLVFGFLLILLTYLLGLIPFGQVLEYLNNKTFTTYYKLGPLKFKEMKWDKVDNVTLEQDQKRYYYLTIRTIGGQAIQLEKHPTLNEANERLREFKELFESS